MVFLGMPNRVQHKSLDDRSGDLEAREDSGDRAKREETGDKVKV